MPVRLFVGNLPYETSEAELREHFAAIGPLGQVFMPVDRDTGRPRGFAFVEFDDPTHAEEAIRRLNNQPFKGRSLAVNEARARDSRPPVGGPPPHRFESRGDAGGLPADALRPRGADAGRRFGPDARPGRGRGGGGFRAQKAERPKGPIRERPGGQLFSTDDDGNELGPEPDIDNFATRASDTDETKDE